MKTDLLNEEELTQKLEAQLRERKNLQAELDNKVRKRSQFLLERKEETKTPDDSFDATVSKMIAKQIAAEK